MKKETYEIILKREISQTVEVRVAAKNEEEARKKALGGEYIDGNRSHDARRIAKAQRDLSDKDWIEWIEQENDKNSQVIDGSFIIVKLNPDRWAARKKEVSK